MKVFCLIFCLLFALGCGGEQPLVSDEEHLVVEDVTAPAPEGEIPTTVIELNNDWAYIKAIQPAVPKKVFVMIDGMLTEIDVVFKERIYYLLIMRAPPFPIDNLPIDPDVNRIEINLLDNHILFPDEIQPWWEDHDDIPIMPTDKLEVIVRHRFKYTREPHQRNPRYTEMLFVDIVRNLRRPNVKF